MLDVLIAAGVAITQIAMAWYGIHVSVKEHRVRNAVIIAAVGIVGLALTVLGTIRSGRTQAELKAQLTTIQHNTETPPQVTVNVPPYPSDAGRKKEQRMVIAGLMNEGENLMNRCKSKERNDAMLNKRSQEWAAKTTKTLVAIDPSFASRFKASVGPMYVFAPADNVNNEVWNFVNVRLQTLTGILQDLRD